MQRQCWPWPLPAAAADRSQGMRLRLPGARREAAKDSLTIALTNEPTTLDPQLAADSIGGMIILNLHDPLVRRDSDGNVVPGLAETWEVSDDGMSITFHLQEGVKFQDGSGLTAEDVAFSLNRAIDKPQSELYTSFMDSAEAVDGSTVKVNLKY